ncbi:hypothetical protein ABW19_dt0200443 [Dactylella cylindrospora]|nr:hypothetical protein ABW19_dt0200443 [Dactylella cylindrospora]
MSNCTILQVQISSFNLHFTEHLPNRIYSGLLIDYLHDDTKMLHTIIYCIEEFPNPQWLRRLMIRLEPPPRDIWRPGNGVAPFENDWRRPRGRLPWILPSRSHGRADVWLDGHGEPGLVRF